MENSIYFGQPLIDAYLLQEEINFYGTVFHASAEKQYEDLIKSNYGPFVHSYSCPFKAGVSKHLTVYPMFANSSNEKKYMHRYKRIINGVGKLRHQTSGSIRKYIDNTEIYLGSIEQIAE